MPSDIEHTLASLDQVAAERALRARDAVLGERVRALKAYQQQRFKNTYADLLTDARYADATRFFLEDLYGPADHGERDAQFGRVVPALGRVFPNEMVTTVRSLATLHALSEVLDTTMARHMGSSALTPLHYAAAWQATGREQDRDRQIVLALEVGEALDRYTRKALWRNSLRLMRGPARSAGLASLQRFLERGFDAFRAMDGAAQFLATIGLRERALAAALFDRRIIPVGPSVLRATHPALAQLP
jgi:hypothetical protein